MSSSSSSSAAAPYQPPEVSGPHPVLLHVYDVTNASSDAINATVAGLNKLTKDVLGLGGRTRRPPAETIWGGSV